MTRMIVPVETLKFSEARPRLSELLNQVFRRQLRVIVEKSGIPVAAIVSADDLRRLQMLEAERETDFRVFDEIGPIFAGATPDEIERETELAVEQARAELRAERIAARET